MGGLSPRNLKYMRAFAEAWPIVQQPVAQLPWGHNVRLLDNVKNSGERLWYAEQTIPERLEPERSRDADRKRPLPAPGEGGNELPRDASQTTVRSCPAAHQGPVQLRFPDACLGGAGA